VVRRVCLCTRAPAATWVPRSRNCDESTSDHHGLQVPTRRGRRAGVAVAGVAAGLSAEPASVHHARGVDSLRRSAGMGGDGATSTAHSATHGRNGASNGATATHSWRDKREWRRYEGTKDMAHKEDYKGTNMCKTNQCTRCHSATLPLQQDPLILWLRILLSNLMSR
jgi:hypothetical protein